MGFVILALYSFVSPQMELSVVEQHKEEIATFLRKHSALGAILLSREGINGTVCYSNPTNQKEGDDDGYDKSQDPVLEFLSKLFGNLQRTRISFHHTQVFFRLRIRVKPEIVTMGVDGVEPCRKVGTYVKPTEWNDLIRDPQTMVLDTRNDYEVDVGTFQNAINPHTSSFPEFPSWLQTQLAEKKPSKIAMFCTGGIRCEKATSYALSLVENENIPIYHLEGGILAYLESVPPEQSTFNGECYVFDQRIAVTHGLKATTTLTQCHACRHPLTPEDCNNPNYMYGVVCPYCVDDANRNRERYETRQMHIKVAEQKGIIHIGSGSSGSRGPNNNNNNNKDGTDATAHHHHHHHHQVPHVSRRGIPLQNS